MKVKMVLNFNDYHIKPVSLDMQNLANCEDLDQSFLIKVYPLCHSETYCNIFSSPERKAQVRY